VESTLIAVVLLGVAALLLALALSPKGRSKVAPSGRRAPWIRVDGTRLEAEILQRLGTSLGGLEAHDGLMDLARRLAYGRNVDQDNSVLTAGDLWRWAASEAPGFGGELLAIEGTRAGESALGEEELAEHLVAALGDWRAGQANCWGLGSAWSPGGSRVVLLLGRMAWRWHVRPDDHADPGYPVRGEGEPTAARWAELVLLDAAGVEQALEVDFYRPELGRVEIIPSRRGPLTIMAGPRGDRLQIASVQSGPPE